MKIVMSAVLALFLIGCGDGNKSETQSVESKAPVASEVKAEAAQVQEEVQAAEETTQEVVQEDAADMQEYVKTSVEEVSKEAKEAVIPAVEEVEAVVEEKVSEVKQEAAEVTSSNGETLYKVCSSCHGPNAEKAALGKSQVIKGWPADKITAALNGYKDGSYGGTMKGIMKGQVSKLSSEDIEALSEYISKL